MKYPHIGYKIKITASPHTGHKEPVNVKSGRKGKEVDVLCLFKSKDTIQHLPKNKLCAQFDEMQTESTLYQTQSISTSPFIHRLSGALLMIDPVFSNKNW